MCLSNERLYEYLGEGRKGKERKRRRAKREETARERGRKRETERRGSVSVDGGETEGKRKS